MNTEKTKLIRPYRISEFAALYEMSIDTFKRRIAHLQPKLGKRIGRWYTIYQVKIIMHYLDTL